MAACHMNRLKNGLIRPACYKLNELKLLSRIIESFMVRAPFYRANAQPWQLVIACLTKVMV